MFYQEYHYFITDVIGSMMDIVSSLVKQVIVKSIKLVKYHRSVNCNVPIIKPYCNSNCRVYFKAFVCLNYLQYTFKTVPPKIKTTSARKRSLCQKSSLHPSLEQDIWQFKKKIRQNSILCVHLHHLTARNWQKMKKSIPNMSLP